MKRAIFFDMNETILNLSLLQEAFSQYFDDPNVLKYWFSKLLHSSTVMGAMDAYVNFGELAAAALESVFVENNMELSENNKQAILSAFKKLPAYDDVVPTLQFLSDQNIKRIAISNSSLDMIEEQLSNAGIIDLFDSYYSVDQVRRYKPFKDIYLAAAKVEGLEIQNIVMVATHDWDIFGAKNAGLKTGYIQRSSLIYNPLYKQADYRDTDLLRLVTHIVESWT